MIVYGDPQYEVRLATLIQRLCDDFTAAKTEPTLDALRALLILAGQAEQAAGDAQPERSVPLPEATDRAAEAFLARWNGAPPARVRHALDVLGAVLERLPPSPPGRVTVKLPEGFALYALYPEQHALAARRWLAEHADASPQRALVVGIRSIGTTLSAVVAAVLRADGWDVRRQTVRPEGHPFQRQVELPRGDVSPDGWALIADEGPGLSGSSIAAVAEALVRAGVDPERISFLPGHEGQPGGQASESVRAWWRRTPRYVVPTDALRWDGRSLPEALTALTPALLGSQEDEKGWRIEDLGGGLWRPSVYAERQEWPAVCAMFECPKYRVMGPDGQAVLWKFVGLAEAKDGPQTEVAQARLHARARAGWTVKPLGSAYGFVATSWITGQPLTVSDGANPAVLAHIGRYIAFSAASSPSQPFRNWAAATRRLQEMLRQNVLEALGEGAAERADQTTSAWLERDRFDEKFPIYGDGHLAPHEWLRTPDGRLVKTDAAGHDTDHTCIGRQSIAWDVAGALVEWELEGERAELLLTAYEEESEWPIPPATLTFYRLAYAAFRLGQTTLCAGMLPEGDDERERLERAAARYRDELSRLLESASS